MLTSLRCAPFAGFPSRPPVTVTPRLALTELRLSAVEVVIAFCFLYTQLRRKGHVVQDYIGCPDLRLERRFSWGQFQKLYIRRRPEVKF